jgi:hypothetical protein
MRTLLHLHDFGPHPVHPRPRLQCVAPDEPAARWPVVPHSAAQVHHGNGTQSLFWEDDRVLFISLHQDGNYPLNSGERWLLGPVAWRMGGGGWLQEPGATVTCPMGACPDPSIQSQTCGAPEAAQHALAAPPHARARPRAPTPP